MMTRFIAIAVTAIALAVPTVAAAQSRDETLADIRQELSVLYVEVQRLKRELSTTGAPSTAIGGSTPLERIDAIERELQRLTQKSEQMGFKIDQIATRGGNQIGDLEFRLCELETDCDIATLSEGTTLGGVEVSETPAIALPDVGQGVELAASERADFDRARAALEEGNLQSAVDQFQLFTQTYPGGPLNAEAHFLRGDALEQLGQIRSAARAYLDSFSSAPNGAMAPNALFKVGTSLGALGQTADACQMLDQVGVRFPDSDATVDAQTAKRSFGCS